MFISLRSFYIMSDTCLSHTMQHFQTDSSTSSPLDIEAWVRGVSSFTEPAAHPKPHPNRRKHIPFDTHSMSSSTNKKIAKSGDSRLTRSMSQIGDQAGSKTGGFTTREKPASSAASGYDLISKSPSSPMTRSSLRTMTSSNGTLATKSSSSKKKTVAKREDLALLNPKIHFRAFEEAEDWGIVFSKPIKDLWSRCYACLL